MLISKLLSFIVLALGGSLYLTPDELDHAYICSVNQDVVIAERLSSTLKTAYWTNELNVTKSKVCTNGIWMNLKQYAKDNNLEINILLENLNQEETPIDETPTNIPSEINMDWGNTIQYKCDVEKCTRVK